MILTESAFAALIWGSLASVVVVFGYLLRTILRETSHAGDSSGVRTEGRS